MISIKAPSSDDAWRQSFDLLRSLSRVQEGRGQPTKELLHVTFEISDPRQRVVFARPINPAFAVAEVIWILAGSNDVSFLKSWNPRIGNFSDDGMTMHGAYGHRLGRRPLLDEEV